MQNSNFLSLLITFFLTIFIFAQSGDAQSVGTTYEDNGKKAKVKHRSSTNSFDIEYEGDITISDNDQDIIAISDGGFFEIKKSAFGSKRRIVIDADGSGTLTRRYYVGRREHKYEPEGRTWLAEILPDVVRSTSFAAKSRVARFYKNGGSKAVINEIKNLEGDYVTSIYFDHLLDYKLNATELADVIRVAGKTIDSDHYMAELLRKNRTQFLQNKQTIDAYIEATSSISSDHYTSEVMRDALKDATLNDEQLTGILKIAKNIDSDHYLAEVLKTVVSRSNLSGHNLEELLGLTKMIESDHYKSEVIRYAVRSNKLTPHSVDIIITELTDVQSDHYALEIISEILDQRLDDRMVSQVLSYTAHKVNSDHYASQAISDVLDRFELEDEGFDALLMALDNISSDHYASQVVRSIGHKKQITEGQLIKLLEAIGRINSDNYLADCLVSIAPRVNECGNAVNEAYTRAAKNINSETYFGRAMRALDR